MDEGFRPFEHTGDLGLEVWAPTPERLYALAAVALAAQEVEIPEGDVGAASPDVEATFQLEGDDPADLLVHWLNTGLLEASVRRVVWTSATVTGLSTDRLRGSLRGPPRDRRRQVFLREIKAVSHHALELDLRPGACRCRLILDL